AGKSTLINIIAGTFPPGAGEMRYRGDRIADLTPHRARLIGISPVFQEFSLVPELTVEQNLFLGHEKSAFGLLDRAGMRREARSIIMQLGFDLQPERKVRDLSRAHQQMVEIAKALLTEVRLLILDEPTASLTDAEAGRLFDLMARLKADGVGIIYVSHRMAEIRRLADRITVLRDGRKIATVATQDVSDTALIELMTGRTAGALFPTIRTSPGETLFEVARLSIADGSVKEASIHVRSGEVVGIAGLVGCGKSELIRAAFGLEKIASGTVRRRGQDLHALTPKTALATGICYFPSDRVAEGLALSRAVRENVSMAALDSPSFARFLMLRRAEERLQAQRIVDKLRLRPPRLEQSVVNLSGGNRQKVVLARAMTRDLDVFLFDEPTVGIDVGAKAEVYELIKDLAERGAAVVVVSSELPEVMNLSHRLYVMHRARVVAELQGAEISEQRVLAHFFADAAHAG
ncbi:MAG: sugar ABC transporter ATP-binding protein, partial [Acetobacteraceae bacterium]|nr:sugar ABC transporter ATP-binding protein [Acetobacteraceae bacterium]